MSSPAYDQLATDIELGFVAWKVYMWLSRNWLSHHTPRETKLIVLQEALHLGPASVLVGLNWLVERGYIVEHARNERGTRRFTLAWNVQRLPPKELPKPSPALPKA